jgi:hypothetical protein
MLNKISDNDKQLLEIYVSQLRWAAHNESKHCYIQGLPDDIKEILISMGFETMAVPLSKTVMVAWTGDLEEIIKKHLGSKF